MKLFPSDTIIATSGDTMQSIDITIGKQSFVLRGEDSEQHLQEVAEMVRRKVDGLRKRDPSIPLQKAAMLVAFDLASELIKGKKRSVEYRAQVISQATDLLQQVEAEIQSGATGAPATGA